MKTLKLTVTLFFDKCGYPGKDVTYADKRIIRSSCKSDLGHRMDCGRVVVFASDAVENLEVYKAKFESDLKSRVYDDVEDLQVTFIDNLEHHLPNMKMY